MSSLDTGAAWQAPMQWPQRDDASGRVVLPPRLLKAAILLAMLALTALDRFGVRITEAGSAPAAMLAMYALVAVIVTSGAAQVSRAGGLAYLGIVFLAGLSLVVNGASLPSAFVSTMSLLYLVALYAPFAVALRPGAVSPALWRWTVEAYVAFALAVAFAGIAQYLVHFVYQPEWLLDYTPFIPEPIRGTSGFNTAYLVQDGAGFWAKSNGFFMREPSIFSVVMAFGLLCEMSLSRRRWVMAAFVMALVLSYSASGLLCLAAGLLFPLGGRMLARIAVAAIIAAALFLVFGDLLNLSYMLNRLEEFGVRNSSAYCRFVYPSVAALEQMDSSPWAALIGHGPGSMERMGADCALGGQTTYAKILFEYGVVGLLAFAAFLVGALKRSGAPVRIRVAAGLAWLMLGGNLLDALYLLFIYVVSAMWPTGIAAEAAQDDPAAAPSRSP